MVKNMRLFTRILVLLLLCSPALRAENVLKLATTTSTADSGLLNELHPPFERANDVRVDVIAVGTGKALRLGENGDVDVVLVHAPAAELKFVQAGHGVDRTAVMHNDFVIVGPEADPAGVRNTRSAVEALDAIRKTGAPFVSRGDDSGTHKKELQIWKQLGVEPTGDWYLAAGQGMAAVLRIAHDKDAYTLADRGTYSALRYKLDLKVLGEGDPILANPYHVMAVNPEKHPHVNYALAKKYIAYLVGKEAQDRIAAFQPTGMFLFVPDARPPHK